MNLQPLETVFFGGFIAIMWGCVRAVFYILVICLWCGAFNAANAATLVNFGATFCSENQHMEHGKCVSNVATGCAANWHHIGTSGFIMFMPYNSGNCPVGYSVQPMPSFLSTGADIVGFGATLCGAARHMEYGTCTNDVQNECPDGAHRIGTSGVNLFVPVTDGTCATGYSLYTDMPIYLSGGSRLVNFGAKLCRANYHMEYGNCVPDNGTGCPSHAHHISTSGKRLYIEVGNDTCPDGYNASVMPSDMYLGPQVVNFGASLCPAGQHLESGRCVQDARDTCPHAMHRVPLANATLGNDGSDAECDTDYVANSVVPICGVMDAPASMCTSLCASGTVATYAGTCAGFCTAATKLRTSTGGAWTLYATQSTTPSIYIQTVSGPICYVNLNPGGARGAVNVQFNNATYHTTQ